MLYTADVMSMVTSPVNIDYANYEEGYGAFHDRRAGATYEPYLSPWTRSRPRSEPGARFHSVGPGLLSQCRPPPPSFRAWRRVYQFHAVTRMSAETKCREPIEQYGNGDILGKN